MGKNKSKKKKSLLRRVLKWSGITLLLLIVAIIAIPFFFKDEIKELVIQEANKELNATLELDDFDLTFFSTFPNLAIQLEGARLKGVDEFEGVTLADIGTFRADMKFWSVVSGDQIEIDAIHLYEPKIDIRVLQDGSANYNITKPDSTKTEEELEEPSSFKLSLKKYSIQNGYVRYKDDPGNLFAEIVNLNHDGSGDLTADVIDFETETTADELTVAMGGISYLSHVKSDFDIDLLMEFQENSSKFTLQDNELQLNAFAFGIDGFYEMVGEKANMDFKLKTEETSFKELISLIPAFYKNGFEDMNADGKLSLNGMLKGEMYGDVLPAWDFGLDVKNASIQYPDLPSKINNIEVQAGSKFKGGSQLDAMTVDVEKFHADFNKNTIDADLKLRNPISDPLIQSAIKADVDLASLGKSIPMEEGEKYSGLLDVDVEIDGRMSALENEDYKSFTAKGTMEMTDVNYASKSLAQNVSISSMLLQFAPQALSLEKCSIKTGKSDFQMQGDVKNYLGYLLRDELLKGTYNFQSNYLDLDELLNLAPAEEGQETQDVPVSDDPVLIPANIDFLLHASMDKVKYNGMEFSNVKGDVRLKDEEATLKNLTFDGMGGKIGLTGKYNTQDHTTPKAEFGYDLEGLDIEKLTAGFLTVGKLAPIAKYVKGEISSNFSMKTDLTPGFEPVLSTLTGLGDLFSNTVTIKGFKPLDKVSETTNLNNLSSQSIQNLNAKFKIEDGKMSFQPFDVNLAGIRSTVSGFTKLDQSIDYDMKMFIPKDKIPADMIKSVEAAASKVNSLSPKLNLSALPEKLPINVDILGTVMDPKVSTNFKKALMEASGNMKDALVEETKKAVKDTITETVTEQVEDVKEEVKENVEEQKQKILSDAQKQADKVIAEGKKAADKICKEADVNYDKAVAAAGSNPFKKKAAEVAAGNARDKAYEKADQVEAEAQKKADAIMDKARKEADRV